NKRNNISKEFHKATYTHILFSRYAEDRKEITGNHSLTHTFAHFIFIKRTLFKEQLHQALIILCCCLNKSIVQFVGLVLLTRRNFKHFRCTSLRTPLVHLHLQYVNHCIELRTDIDGILNYNSLIAERFVN